MAQENAAGRKHKDHQQINYNTKMAAGKNFLRPGMRGSRLKYGLSTSFLRQQTSQEKKIVATSHHDQSERMENNDKNKGIIQDTGGA